METLANPGLRGRAFVDALSSLGDAWGSRGHATGALETPRGRFGRSLGTPWEAIWGLPRSPGRFGVSQTGQHGSSEGQLGDNMNQHEPTKSQHGANLEPTRANLGPTRPTRDNLRITSDQHGPTRANWGQLGSNLGRANPEKTAFRLDGNTIFKVFAKIVFLLFPCIFGQKTSKIGLFFNSDFF